MGIVEGGEWKVSGFWSRPVPVQKYSFNDIDNHTDFYGVYGAGKIAGLGVDLYYLGLDRDAASFNGTGGEEERHTVGGRDDVDFAYLTFQLAF